MRKSRCKHTCKHCGLPITKVTKKYKPATWKLFPGEYVHTEKCKNGNYFFMCDLVDSNSSRINELRDLHAEVADASIPAS